MEKADMANKPAETAESGDQMQALVPGSDDRPNISNVLIGDQQYAVKQIVNVPVLKQDSNQTVAIRIEQPIRHELSKREVEFLDRETGEVRKGEQENPISVVRVTELNSGRLFNYVLNAIAASELERAYPENGYVGKMFAIRKLGVVAGKRYKQVEIVEIEPADKSETAA